MKVLCAEDHEDTRWLMVAVLEEVGLEVRTAATTGEALRLACTERFDLFLLDKIMPNGDSLDLCRKLRKMFPKVPIIFYSAAAGTKDKEAAMAAGATCYLVKPNDTRRLPKVVMHYLNRQPC